MRMINREIGRKLGGAVAYLGGAALAGGGAISAVRDYNNRT